jgi:hypothetical protein
MQASSVKSSQPSLKHGRTKSRVVNRNGGLRCVRTSGLRVLGLEGQFQSEVSEPSLGSTGWPNPSVEGTHNGGARLLASATSAAPSCAPHVKR